MEMNNSVDRELRLRLTILADYLECLSHNLCRCENNGDYCEFHEMLSQARKALKGEMSWQNTLTKR